MTSYPISLIIPVLNEEPIIGKLLLQFAGQNKRHPPFRLVIVDNGSHDRTAHLVTMWCKKLTLPHLLLHEPVRGIAEATKRGFEAALDSRVLVKLDADSRVSPSFLHDVWNEINKPETDGIYGSFVFPWDIYIGWSTKKRSVYTTLTGQRKQISQATRRWRPEIFQGPFYAVTSRAYRKSGGVQLGATVLRYNDDIEFSVRLDRMGFRIRKTGISVGISPRRLEEHFDAYVTGELYWGESPDTIRVRHSQPTVGVLTERMIRAVASFHLRLLAYQLMNGSRTKSMQVLFDAIGIPVEPYRSMSMTDEQLLRRLKKDAEKKIISYLYRYV